MSAAAQISFGGRCTIMVSEVRVRSEASRASLYLYAEDADAAIARAVAAGGNLICAATDMPYDDRQGGVTDPEGYIWWISQRLVEAPYFER